MDEKLKAQQQAYDQVWRNGLEKGKEQRDILRLIWNNVRLAEGVQIDCYAMIAATQVAEQRLTELVGTSTTAQAWHQPMTTTA